MELTKNIFFNTDKLVGDSTVKIFYTGKFFEEQAEEVYLHYGYGLLWDQAGEVKMEITDFGYEAEITLPTSDALNFCFRSGNDDWDNNDFQNYSFPIELSNTSLVAIEDQPEFLIKHPGLRKSYIWSKKVRLAIYKIITFVPKLISGNYKRVKNEEE